MRRLLLITAAAVLAGAASAASAQTAPQGPAPARVLSWPGKTMAAPPAEAAAAGPTAFSYAPPAVPPPFTASTMGSARVNNRYSPRVSVAKLASHTPTRPAPPFNAPVFEAPAAAPASTVDYGPPVVPNEVKPARTSPAVPAPVVTEAPPQPVSANTEPPAKSARGKPATAKPAPAPTAQPAQAAAAPSAPTAERPFIRPASPNGPRFYSVHREFGGRPDATFRSAPAGAATERLPSGFFAGGAQEEAEEEPQDDAETRAAALRAAEKANKARGKARR